MKTWRKRMTS